MQLEFEFMKDLDQCVCNGKGCACHDLDAVPAENLKEHNNYIMSLRDYESKYPDQVKYFNLEQD